MQIVFTEHTADFSLGTDCIVPEKGFKTVGGKYHGATAEFTLQGIGIKDSLLAPRVGIFTGTLCFDNPKGKSVFAEKHIVHKPVLSGNVIHILHRIFFLHVRIGSGKLPAQIFKVYINVGFSCLKFGYIFYPESAFFPVVFFFRSVMAGQFCYLFPQGFDFSFFFFQKAFLFFYFFNVNDHCPFGNQIFVKGAFGIVFPVTEINPPDKIEKSF